MNSSEYFAYANDFYNNRQYSKAISYYEKAINIKKADFDKSEIKENNFLANCYYNIATCYIKLYNYELSIKYNKLALKYYAKMSKYYFNLGYCYTQLSKFKLAYIYFNKAWALDNSDNECEKALKFLDKRLSFIN